MCVSSSFVCFPFAGLQFLYEIKGSFLAAQGFGLRVVGLRVVEFGFRVWSSGFRAPKP